MKSLYDFVNEALKPEETFLTAVKNTKLNKEQLREMVTGLKQDGVKRLSNYLKQNYSSEYIAYEPNPDLFLKDYDKAVDNITSFILTMEN